MGTIKKIKKHRLHREGTETLLFAFAALAALNSLVFYLTKDASLVPFYIVVAISLIVYAIVVNFFRCPIRVFEGEADGVVVAPADGKVVVVEEVDENEYFRDRRLMISVFMSLTNVHANWFPVEGVVKKALHHNGNFHKAWLPKASTENERSTVVITMPDGRDVLVRQVAGAVARRIVTYAHEGEECFIDEHMGFIKFGSRVDVYLPLDAEVCVKVGQSAMGNHTVIARLKRGDIPSNN